VSQRSEIHGPLDQLSLSRPLRILPKKARLRSTHTRVERVPLQTPHAYTYKKNGSDGCRMVIHQLIIRTCPLRLSAKERPRMQPPKRGGKAPVFSRRGLRMHDLQNFLWRSDPTNIVKHRCISKSQLCCKAEQSCHVCGPLPSYKVIHISHATFDPIRGVRHRIDGGKLHCHLPHRASQNTNYI